MKYLLLIPLLLAGCNNAPVETSKTVLGAPFRTTGTVEAYTAGPPSSAALLRIHSPRTSVLAGDIDLFLDGPLRVGDRVDVVLARKYNLYFENGKFTNIGYGDYQVVQITVLEAKE